MKNYLFAPFKDDDDKIREFNAMFKALTHLIDADHELHVIRVFVCRLESYHDSIIQDMHNNKAEIVDGLLEESNLLKAELQAVNDKDGLYDEVKELQAENEKIRAYIELRDKQIYTINDLNKINDRLVEQVNYNRGNNSNVRTISGEIAEYISHNPKSSARLFLIPHHEFKNGEFNNDSCIYWDDGME